ENDVASDRIAVGRRFVLRLEDTARTDEARAPDHSDIVIGIAVRHEIVVSRKVAFKLILREVRREFHRGFRTRSSIGTTVSARLVIVQPGRGYLFEARPAIRLPSPIEPLPPPHRGRQPWLPSLLVRGGYEVDVEVMGPLRHRIPDLRAD